MPVLDARDLLKIFGPDRVLDEVSLALETGEKVGLIGPNGSGKSTLGRILAGLDTPDGGLLAVQRGARISYLSQTPDLDDERTALDEALAGLTEWNAAKRRFDEASQAAAEGRRGHESELARATNELERAGGWDPTHRAEAMLAELGVGDPSARVGKLSGGERRRVALARALVAEPDLAILDEPTNHLVIEAIEWLERHLVNGLRGAVLLITHDRALLDAVVARTLELDRGRLHAYDGGWEAYLEGKAERLAAEQRVEANRRNMLRTELEWLRRQPKARTGKSKSRIARAEAAIAAAPSGGPRNVELAIDAARSGKRIVELRNLAIEGGGRRLVDGLDLTIVAGERLGILGPNGCGKTTLLRTIAGDLTPAAGEVVRGKTAQVAFLSQERDDLDPTKSVLDNVAPDGAPVALGTRTVEARSYLSRFGFPYTQMRQPVSSLSGGERARVALAKLLQRSVNLLLLDEPTNDLDVDTLGALEELLVEFAGTALVVTHDRWFLDRVATGILVFDGEGQVVRHEGGYSAWRERRRLEDAQATPAVRPAPPPKERPKPARAGLSYKEKLELERIVDDIEAAEARVGALETELADPELYRGGGAEVPRRMAELEAVKREVARLTARWEELSTREEVGAKEGF